MSDIIEENLKQEVESKPDVSMVEIPDKADKVSKEELAEISKLQNDVDIAELKLENAKLKQQAFVQHIFINYKLGIQDRIDPSTGVITRVGGADDVFDIGDVL